jgi:hypothetical protein
MISKQKYLFKKKDEGQESKTSPVWGLEPQWEVGKHKESVEEGEYGGSTKHSSVKMEQCLELQHFRGARITGMSHQRLVSPVDENK